MTIGRSAGSASDVRAHTICLLCGTTGRSTPADAASSFACAPVQSTIFLHSMGPLSVATAVTCLFSVLIEYTRGAELYRGTIIYRAMRKSAHDPKRIYKTVVYSKTAAGNVVAIQSGNPFCDRVSV